MYSLYLGCVEKGYHWIGDHEVVAESDRHETAKSCQQLCQLDDRCNWFNWRDSIYPTRCWLLKNKGKMKKYNLGRSEGSTGPKQCSGIGICLINYYRYISQI